MRRTVQKRYFRSLGWTVLSVFFYGWNETYYRGQIDTREEQRKGQYRYKLRYIILRQWQTRKFNRTNVQFEVKVEEEIEFLCWLRKLFLIIYGKKKFATNRRDEFGMKKHCADFIYKDMKSLIKTNSRSRYSLHYVHFCPNNSIWKYYTWF